MSALFKTIAEIKEHLAVNLASNINSLLPYIKRAESKYIISVLGKDQYKDLMSWYHQDSGSSSSSGSGIPLTENEQQDLLEKVQEPLANLAYLLYIPMGNVQASDGGFTVMETTNKKIASQYRIEDLKKSFREAGHEGIDTLLEFLEDNADTYNLWKSSSAYTVFKQFFINTAGDFSEYYNISSSRLTFLAMKSTMKKIEEFEIRQVISKALFDKIKAEIAGTLSADNQTLLDDYIKPAVAHLTIARAAIDLPVAVTDSGLFIGSIVGEKISQKKKAPDPNISALIGAAQRDGQAYIEQMERFLNDNPDKYPEYKASDIFDDADNASKNDLDNKSTNSHYAV